MMSLEASGGSEPSTPAAMSSHGVPPTILPWSASNLWPIPIENGLQIGIIATSGLCVIFPTVFVILRVIAKWRVRNRLNWSDIFIFIALVSRILSPFHSAANSIQIFNFGLQSNTVLLVTHGGLGLPTEELVSRFGDQPKDFFLKVGPNVSSPSRHRLIVSDCVGCSVSEHPVELHYIVEQAISSITLHKPHPGTSHDHTCGYNDTACSVVIRRLYHHAVQHLPPVWQAL